MFISETIPNDTFSVSSEVLLKLAPMVAPIFHRLHLYIHFFFVPNRLLWEDWETFITGGRLGEAITAPPVPPFSYIDSVLNLSEDVLDSGGLGDYLGIPPMPDSAAATWGNRALDLMPFAACYKVHYDYYRDRNFTNDTEFLPLPSGESDPTTSFNLMRIYQRAWEHDYFTSAQLTTQRGQEVMMPLSGGTGPNIYDRVTGDPITGANRFIGVDQIVGVVAGDPVIPVWDNAIPAEFRITNSEISINDVRRAFALQTWMERNQLAGARYPESNMAHFGRKSSDGRLQRAEYLGGGKAVLQISEVMTTSYSEDADTNVVPPANPSGRGWVYSTTNKFHYNCEEHGFVVGFLSVMPSSAYMQGIPRMFLSRNTFLDYPWPTMAHLGEQEVWDYEIFADPGSIPVESRTTFPLFGYQSRYSDWKFIHNSSHGDFRTTLSHWHVTRTFSGQPALGNEFIEFEDALQDRIFNVAEVDTLWMYVYNEVKVKRALPYFGTPRTI